MADARTRQWRLQFEYQFDRLLPERLAQAYELLVPDEVRPLGSVPMRPPKRNQEIMNDETSRHLYARVV